MKYSAVGLLIALALVARLLPHPDNFTPVLAVALFGGATLPGAAAYAVPLAAMAGSDLALGEPLTWTTAIVYACFLAAARLGRWVGANRTWAKTIAAALGGSLAFFLATNLAVWLFDALYAQTWDGLIECYAMAIPFFGNSLAGDLFWVVALFGVLDLATRQGRTQAAPG